MLLRLLKNNRAGGILFIIFLVVLLWLRSFLHPEQPDSGYHMPFYHLVASIVNERPLLATFAALLLNVTIAVTLVRLNVRYFLLDDRSFMPAAFYMLIATANPELHRISPVLIGSLFLLFTLLILFAAKDDRPDSLRIFNASLVLVAGSMFYLKLVWFVPFIWITIGHFRPIRWREVLYPILAFAMLGLFLFTYFWVIREELPLLREYLVNNLQIRQKQPDLSVPWLISYGWLFLLIILASAFILRKFQTGKIIVRKIYQVLFFLFLYSVGFYLFIAPFDKDVLVMAAIPVSYLLANYFHQRRTNWVHEMLLWIWLGSIAYLQLSPS